MVGGCKSPINFTPYPKLTLAMDNRFDNRDFEQFVKQNADQYRMFPSENVWKGIHNSLHTRRRWFGVGLAFLILTTGVVTWVMLGSYGKNNNLTSTSLKKVAPQPIKEKAKVSNIAIVAPGAVKQNAFIDANSLQTNLFVTSKITDDQIESINEPSANTYNQPKPVSKTEAIYQPEPTLKNIALARHPVAIRSVTNKSIRSTVAPFELKNNSIAALNNIAESEETSPSANEEKLVAKNDNYPFSIENVINSYVYVKKRRRTSFQVFLTPTISYRELKENKPFINSAQNALNNTNYTYFTDINSLVTHKPDIGLQLGFTGGFSLTRNLKLIGGLQFNISKYDIQAYNHTSEVTTIALRNSSGGTNTVYTMSNYRNGAGFRANWLHNLYLSISAPIGLELKLIGSGKSYLGISGTVQPTYVLKNKAYLISTDYKNYAEVPSLTRKWNINTGFEMFVGYSTGKLKWRVGPQVRYQAMSSFIKKYPVQEHLFDFGLKMGIMLNK